MNIKTKIFLMVLLPLIFMVSMLIISSVVDASSKVQKQEEQLITQSKEKLEEYVNIALNSISSIYEMSKSENIAKVLEMKTTIFKKRLNNFYERHQHLESNALRWKMSDFIQNYRYGENGWFFVIDTKGKMIAHPTNPKLVGHNMLQEGEAVDQAL